MVDLQARGAGSPPSDEGTLHCRNILHVAIEVETPVAAFAADSGIAASAERCGQFAHEEAVDPYGAGDDPLRQAHCALLALAEDHRGQAIVGTVPEPDGFFFVAEGLPGQYGSEDLALHNLHLLRHPIEQGRLEVQLARAVPMATPDRLDTGVQGAIDESLDAPVVLRRDERTDAGVLVARIANRELGYRGAELRLKLVRYFCVDQDTGTCQADLTGIEILSSGSLRCGIQVRIGTDDERRLTPE